jgi:hypothetical protein
MRNRKKEDKKIKAKIKRGVPLIRRTEEHGV